MISIVKESAQQSDVCLLSYNQNSLREWKTLTETVEVSSLIPAEFGFHHPPRQATPARDANAISI
jgi:hypothetical protein